MIVNSPIASNIDQTFATLGLYLVSTGSDLVEICVAYIFVPIAESISLWMYPSFFRRPMRPKRR
jgi:hypothetical protein